MQNFKLMQKATSLVTIMLLLSLSGCAAKYHTIRKSQGGENQDLNEGGDANPKSQAPSAQVEVIVEGSHVVKVKAGSTFIIRPSESTMDPDYRDIKDCRNPGIVKAVYTPGPDGQKTSSRSNTGCETLEVEHSFDIPGMYEIGMTVTSNDNESASSKMMLEVTPADGPDDQTQGGFVVTATPLIVEVGEHISFKGDCTGGTTISWDYRDQTSGVGTETQKAYNSPGQYVVLATCKTVDESTLEGQVTVVVVPKKTNPSTPMPEEGPGTDIPSDSGGNEPGNSPGTPNEKPTDKPLTPSDEPVTPDNDDDKPGVDPGNPGQNPNQNPGQTVLQG